MIKLGSKEFDLTLLGAALLLAAIGILLIYSAKLHSDSIAERGIYVKQIIWVLVGLSACVLTFFVPLRFYEVFSYLIWVFSILTLVLILMIGSSKMGATRWISLGGFNIQPSEFAKIATIFPLARYLAYSKRSVYSFRWLVTVVGMALLPALLILRQPDLGTSLVFFAILISMLFWSGVPLFYLFLIVSPFISLVCTFHWLPWALFFLILVLLLYFVRPGVVFSVGFLLLNLASGMITPLVWNKLHHYQQQRIRVFLDPGKDPQGAGYQIIQSKVAIGSGGLAGKGFLEGSQTKLAFLPHQHTDFVFSVLGEEFGFFGGVVLLGLFGFLVFRGIRIARKARNTFASNVTIGLTAVIGFQMVVNIGMTLGVMPVTGLPLPFVSYGGSSMLLSWVALGILLAINSRWFEY
ncbi:MAG: rod shape-determining protein RodA [Candidatus Zixiibacteriota bacterium]|nr:MAG: rod shape-determining protein RodA [candidate division Zixibacteria bacterium]